MHWLARIGHRGDRIRARACTNTKFTYACTAHCGIGWRYHAPQPRISIRSAITDIGARAGAAPRPRRVVDRPGLGLGLWLWLGLVARLAAAILLVAAARVLVVLAPWLLVPPGFVALLTASILFVSAARVIVVAARLVLINAARVVVVPPFVARRLEARSIVVDSVKA